MVVQVVWLILKMEEAVVVEGGLFTFWAQTLHQFPAVVMFREAWQELAALLSKAHLVGEQVEETAETGLIWGKHQHLALTD